MPTPIPVELTPRELDRPPTNRWQVNIVQVMACMVASGNKSMTEPMVSRSYGDIKPHYDIDKCIYCNSLA